MTDLPAVRSLLKDVALEGVQLIPKRKLLWLLGWGQDREGAWEDLLRQWVNNGEERDSLMHIEVAGKIVLTVRSNADYCPVSTRA